MLAVIAAAVLFGTTGTAQARGPAGTTPLGGGGAAARHRRHGARCAGSRPRRTPSTTAPRRLSPAHAARDRAHGDHRSVPGRLSTALLPQHRAKRRRGRHGDRARIGAGAGGRPRGRADPPHPSSHVDGGGGHGTGIGGRGDPDAAVLGPVLARRHLGGRDGGVARPRHTIAVAYTLFTWGLERLSAATSATLTLAEPLTASLLGIAVLGERLTATAAAGLIVLAGGLLVLAWGSRR